MLVFYGMGRIMGFVVNFGDSVIYVVLLVYGGYEWFGVLVWDLISRFDFGGCYIIDYMIKFLRESGYNFVFIMREYEVVENFKYLCCYIVFDFENEIWLWVERELGFMF